MLLLTGTQYIPFAGVVVSHPLSLYRRNYPLNKQKFSHAVLPRLSSWFATISSQGPFFRHTTTTPQGIRIRRVIKLSGMSQWLLSCQLKANTIISRSSFNGSVFRQGGVVGLHPPAASVTDCLHRGWNVLSAITTNERSLCKSTATLARQFAGDVNCWINIWQEVMAFLSETQTLDTKRRICRIESNNNFISWDLNGWRALF